MMGRLQRAVGWLERVRWIAVNTVTEVVRQKSLWIFGVIAGVAVGGGWWWRDFRFGTEEGRFLMDFGHAAQSLVAVGAAVVLTAQGFGQDRSSGAVAVLLAGPVAVSEYLWGKLAGIWCIVVTYAAVSSCGLVIGLRWSGWVSVGDTEIWHLFGLGARLAVVISLTAWFASYGRSLSFVILAAFFGVGLGQLRFLIDGDQRWLSWMVRVVPDWPSFGGSVLEDWSGRGGVLGYALIYGLSYAMLATWGLRAREI